MAAWLMRGASTCWAQPCSSATRPRLSPTAGKTLPPAGPGAGSRFGASASIALIRRNRPGVAAAFGAGSRRRERPAEPRHDHAGAKQVGPRQHEGQHRAQRPLGQRPRIVPLDPDPRLIDQMHVVHARRAGGHAGEAGQAAVDMLDHLRRRRLVLFQHLLDQIDAAARAIEFVAEQHIGRTGRGAEPAMHAGAQDLVGFRDIGIGELGEREFGFHVADPRAIRPRLRMFLGSKLWRTRSLKRRQPARLRMEHIDIAPHELREARISVAWPPSGLDALTHQRRLRVRLRRQRRPDQAAAPVVDHVAAGIARQRLAERAARGRRTDDPPHRPGAERAIGRERLDVADRTPDRRRGRILQHVRGPERRQRLAERTGAMRDRGRNAFQPQQRHRLPRRAEARQRAGRGPERRIRQMRRARHVERRAQRRRHRAVGGEVVEPAQHQRALALGPAASPSASLRS